MKWKKSTIAVSVLAVFVTAMLAVPYVVADTTQVTYNIDWGAYADADEVINRAGEGATNNVDTWGAWRPDGVYCGSYTPENELALELMMKHWYLKYTDDGDGSTGTRSYAGGKTVLAQKVKYTAQQIMSGASMMYIRLPIKADDFTGGEFFVIESTNGSDMSLQYTAAYNTIYQGDLYYNLSGNYTKIFDERFTYDMPAGNEIVAAKPFNTNHTSMTTDIPYVYNNRVYVPLKAPLEPDTYYTFVTEAYAKSTITGNQTSIYVTGDQISALSASNMQTLIGYGTDDNIDELTYAVHTPPVSLGYSTVFAEGYGNRISGYSHYFEAGDTIRFWRDLDYNIPSGKYPTLMFPWLEATNGSEVNISVHLWGIGKGIHLYQNDTVHEDFALINFSTSTSAACSKWRIDITFNGPVRIGLFLKEPDSNSMDLITSTQCAWYHYNETDTYVTDGSYLQIHNGSIPTTNLFFDIYAPLHFSDTMWQRYKPNITVAETSGFWSDFANKIYCGATGFLITAAGATPVGMAVSAIMSSSHNPGAMMKAGIQLALHQDWSEFNKFVGDASAGIQDALDGAASTLGDIGEFVHRVANAIATTVQWVIEKITHYGGIIMESFTKMAFPFLLFIGILAAWGWFLNSMMYLMMGDLERFKGSAMQPFRKAKKTVRRWR